MATFLVLQGWSSRHLLLRVNNRLASGLRPFRPALKKLTWEHKHGTWEHKHGRRVASSEETCSELHVGDSVMIYVSPKPGFPTKLQNLWQGLYFVVKCLEGNTYRLKHQQNIRKRVLRHRDQLRIVSTRPERLRPKTPTTPEREKSHTTSQTLQQDGDPSSLTTATPEKPAGSCTGTARGTREETDVKRDKQQLEPANDVTNPESRVNDPDCRKTSRTRWDFEIRR